MPKTPAKKSPKPKTKTKPKAKTKSPSGAGRGQRAVAVHRFEKIEMVRPEGRALGIEIDPRRIDETLNKFKSELVHWANKGRYTKVRFKFRGKQLLPDLPLAAVAAAEGLTFYWGGILRALIVNFAGKAVFDVE